VEAYDARTGDRAWTFRTSPTGALVRPGPASTFQLDGSMNVDEVRDELGIDLGEGDFETVGGFIFALLARPAEVAAA